MGIIIYQENSIEFIPHTQTLTQQKRLNERDHHIPLNISNVNGINFFIKRHQLTN
jgi:hypothetical protein